MVFLPRIRSTCLERLCHLRLSIDIHYGPFLEATAYTPSPRNGLAAVATAIPPPGRLAWWSFAFGADGFNQLRLRGSIPVVDGAWYPPPPRMGHVFFFGRWGTSQNVMHVHFCWCDDVTDFFFVLKTDFFIYFFGEMIQCDEEVLWMDGLNHYLV